MPVFAISTNPPVSAADLVVVDLVDHELRITCRRRRRRRSRLAGERDQVGRSRADLDVTGGTAERLAGRAGEAVDRCEPRAGIALGAGRACRSGRARGARRARGALRRPTRGAPRCSCRSSGRRRSGRGRAGCCGTPRSSPGCRRPRSPSPQRSRAPRSPLQRARSCVDSRRSSFLVDGKTDRGTRTASRCLVSLRDRAARRRRFKRRCGCFVTLPARLRPPARQRRPSGRTAHHGLRRAPLAAPPARSAMGSRPSATAASRRTSCPASE